MFLFSLKKNCTLRDENVGKYFPFKDKKKKKHLSKQFHKFLISKSAFVERRSECCRQVETVILQPTNIFLQDSGFRGFSPLQASHHRRGVDVTDSHLLQEEVNHRGVVVAMATPEYVFIRLTGVCSCSNTPTVSKLRKTNKDMLFNAF